VGLLLLLLRVLVLVLLLLLMLVLLEAELEQLLLSQALASSRSAGSQQRMHHDAFFGDALRAPLDLLAAVMYY
jgi:hypothetical protein